MTARTGRGRGKRFRRRNGDETATAKPASARDLSDVVGEFLIPDADRDATSHWHPSRRGNSPHHRD
jgi:hypothetical protein